ncbi:hypothetical protein BJ508DRAFT_312372 [Ascobolus immersus RN42]|uniref:Uncharacterized protein n=1 Tax=Ascobolus immersus RN42 TaxID=1160509 RepID=A0A3N4HMN7_ASCIM|nr:hypothetical protein BJ508DRAFT_312372 [Ascobolus immersus RN42]
MVMTMYGYERDGMVRSDSTPQMDSFSIDSISNKVADATSTTTTPTRPININSSRSSRKSSYPSSISTSRPRHSRGYSSSSTGGSRDYGSVSTTPTTITSDYASTPITSPAYSPASASLRHAYSATSKRRSPRLSLQKDSPAGSPIDEEYRRYSLDERRSSSTHRFSKVAKPLLKIKSSQRSSSNSLDLSQPGGGEGGHILGLGIYQDPFVYDSSDFEHNDLFMSRHRRNTSGGSYHGQQPTQPAWGNATYAHPKRQTPRPYTPSPSYACSSADTSDDESAMPTPRPRVSMDRSRPSLSHNLRISTHNVTISGTCTPTTSTPVLISPHGISTSSKKHTVVIPPPLSPTFETAVQKERMKWDKKEAIKEEKAAQKARRRSEQKERRSFDCEAGLSLSPVLGASLESIHSLSATKSKKDRTRSWDISSKIGSKRKSSSEVGKDSGEKERSSQESLGGNTFISLGGAVVEEPEELTEMIQEFASIRGSSSLDIEAVREKAAAATAKDAGKGPSGLKKGWQEFIMWCRIKLIRMRRKLKGKRGSSKKGSESEKMPF